MEKKEKIQLAKKKIQLAKEVMTQLYQIAKYYEGEAQQYKCKVKDLQGEIDSQKKRIREILSDTKQQIQSKDTEIADKNREIERLKEQQQKYLEYITNTFGRRLDEIKAAQAADKNHMDEQFIQLLAQLQQSDPSVQTPQSLAEEPEPPAADHKPAMTAVKTISLDKEDI